MKRKETFELDNLSNVFDGLKVLDCEDELELLIQSIKNNTNNSDEKAKSKLIKSATIRYTRYLRGIDLAELPFLECSINKFLQCPENDVVSKLQLMKQIDEYIYNIISSTSHPNNKKQCSVA